MLPSTRFGLPQSIEAHNLQRRCAPVPDAQPLGSRRHQPLSGDLSRPSRKGAPEHASRHGLQDRFKGLEFCSRAKPFGRELLGGSSLGLWRLRLSRRRSRTGGRRIGWVPSDEPHGVRAFRLWRVCRIARCDHLPLPSSRPISGATPAPPRRAPQAPT
jgi:hypothetical protein